MSKDQNKNTLVFFDTETTGKEGRLIQLCYWNPDAGPKPVTDFYKPPVPIEIEAMMVHHITQKQIDQYPPMEDLGREYLREIFEKNIMVAHNAAFDVKVMEREEIKTPRFICTYKVVQALYDLPSYKLQYLRYLWDIEITATAHDAEGDVLVLQKVFEKMLADQMVVSRRILPGQNLTENDHRQAAILTFEEISQKPTLVRRITFGKHTGKSFEEISKVDPGYLRWITGNPDFDPDMLYTAQYWLSGGQKRLV